MIYVLIVIAIYQAYVIEDYAKNLSDLEKIINGSSN
jgi:hypothetical protein